MEKIPQVPQKKKGVNFLGGKNEKKEFF